MFIKIGYVFMFDSLVDFLSFDKMSVLYSAKVDSFKKPTRHPFQKNAQYV